MKINNKLIRIENQNLVKGFCILEINELWINTVKIKPNIGIMIS